MLDILVTSFGVEHELKCFVHSLLSQEDPNWRCRILSDGDDPKYETNQTWLDSTIHDSRIIYDMSEKRHNDWGHSLRGRMISELPDDSKYVVLQNSDNYLMPNYVKHFNIQLQNNFDIIFCNFMNNKENNYDRLGKLNRYYDTKLVFSKIDMGCFCVKSEVAKNVGFKHIKFESDWLFIKDCMNHIQLLRQPSIQKIPLGLYVHN